LRSLNLSEHQLPIINQSEMLIKTESKAEVFDDNNKSYSHFSSTNGEQVTFVRTDELKKVQPS
jgi:hypothetical protein